MSKTQSSTRNPKAKAAFVTSSDFTTTSATLVDITGISISVSANAKYIILGSLWIGMNNTGGMKFALSGPAGSAVVSGVFEGSSTGAQNSQQSRFNTMGSGSTTNYQRVNNASGAMMMLGFITIGSTGGTLKLQVASANAGETATIAVGTGIALIEYQ